MKRIKRLSLISILFVFVIAFVVAFAACTDNPDTDGEDQSPKDLIENNTSDNLPTVGSLIFTDKGDYYEVSAVNKNISGSITIPGTYNGKPVNIGSGNNLSGGPNGFQNCKSLTNVIMQDGVKSIGYWSFDGCSSLTSVVMPDSVTSVNRSAFEGCTSLTSVTLPKNLTNIAVCMFEGCTSLKNITIPNTVTEIRSSAFEGCTALKSITIPNSVKEIVYHAFYNCSSLENVYYKGTEAQWKKVTCGDDVFPLVEVICIGNS